MVPHAEEMREMASSVFCPVLPGDTQSSRRLGEAFLAGCIPVFIGAPWHTLSMPGFVDYARAAVFISVRQRPWFIIGGPMDRNGRTIGDDWYLDATPPVGAVHVVDTIDDVLPLLRSIPDDRREAMRAAVLEYRPLFSHAPLDGAETSPLTDLILERACLAATRQGHPGRIEQRR